MRITTQSASASVSLPVTVTYTCEHCGHQNEDNWQTLRVSRNSRSSIAGVSQQMRESASERANAAFGDLLGDLKQKKYRKAGLTCRCGKCGKSQSWSSFLVKPLIISVVPFALGAVFLIVFFFSIGSSDQDRLWLMPVASAVLMLPLIIFYVINLVKEQIASKKPDKYQPVITVRDTNPK